MTPTALEKENAALREQLADAIARGEEALNLAVETSTKYDEATALVASLTGAVVKLKDGAPPAAPAAAPPPPPVPATPPPPRPSSYSAFLRLPLHEQKTIAAAHGGRDRLESELHAEMMGGIQARNAAHGCAPDYLSRATTSRLMADAKAGSKPPAVGNLENDGRHGIGPYVLDSGPEARSNSTRPAPSSSAPFVPTPAAPASRKVRFLR